MNIRWTEPAENNDSILILGIIHVARDMNNINPHPWEVM